jgi:hypothetical protein
MRILEEAQPEKALGLLQAWGALQHLHPSLRLAPPLMKAFHLGLPCPPLFPLIQGGGGGSCCPAGPHPSGAGGGGDHAPCRGHLTHSGGGKTPQPDSGSPGAPTRALPVGPSGPNTPAPGQEARLEIS